MRGQVILRSALRRVRGEQDTLSRSGLSGGPNISIQLKVSTQTSTEHEVPSFKRDISPKSPSSRTRDDDRLSDLKTTVDREV
jgi:hypothetical protein